ncbi:hypothetical protein chiPu_0029229, partial [Chiloscyllium punctatum]|nr:hypothetical protein [Chiloscyllium punctatum]
MIWPPQTLRVFLTAPTVAPADHPHPDDELEVTLSTYMTPEAQGLNIGDTAPGHAHTQTATGKAVRDQKDQHHHHGRERETGRYGHGHSHGAGDMRNAGIATIAWMVIVGDGAHNFTDGLAIGKGVGIEGLSQPGVITAGDYRSRRLLQPGIYNWDYHSLGIITAWRYHSLGISQPGDYHSLGLSQPVVITAWGLSQPGDYHSLGIITARGLSQPGDYHSLP